ncbi:MAG: ABC transporter ATP-binding protein [Gammaproteobacteria bacterium]|jgi:osmoprotectant transport system ATP-binding protein
MLALQNISKRFGDHVAVQPLSLTVEKGGTTVLIGPSGCGKSTILRMIIGLVRPDSGTVFFDGTAVVMQNLASVRRRIGYVIQDGGLFPHMTARENVTVMARHLRWSKPRIADRVTELARLVKLEVDLLGRYPAELSGGQRQRVSLMRALMLDPEVLLMDEPFAALDPMIRFDLQRDMKSVFRQLGKTVLFVTHDLGEAAYLADTLVLLREGRVVQQGTYRDLEARPAGDFVRRFVQAQRPAPSGEAP